MSPERRNHATRVAPAWNDGGFSLQKSFTSGPSIGNVERVSSDVTTCDAGGALASRVIDVSYGYDPANGDRLTSITPQGGTGDISAALPPTSESFRWDLSNRLVSISRAGGPSEKLAYAGSGELVRRQLGNEVVFYVGEHATIRGTLPPTCSEPSTTCQVDSATVVVDAHVLLRSTRVASVSAARTLFYYRDHHGSVVATSLGGGQLGAQYRYTAYGELDRVVGENAATASELGYTSGLKLSGDLLHLRARVYHPRLKRFLSADVIDLYRYTYTLGDPVNLVDPSGLQSASDQQALECDYDAGYCINKDGDRIDIIAPEQVVRTGTREADGEPDMEWSDNRFSDDPLESGRYGKEDWDASERGGGDPTGGDRGSLGGTTGGEHGGSVGSGPARQRVPGSPGDWSNFWSQAFDRAVAILADTGPLDITEGYTEEIGIASLRTAPVTLSGPGVLTKEIAGTFVLKDIRAGSADALTVLVTKEGARMTGATVLRISAAAGWGIVAGAGIEGIRTQARDNLARDIEAVFSRGRGP